MAGATSTKFTVTKTETGVFTYYCKVTDSTGQTLNSNKVTLTVTSTIILTASVTPVSNTATTGQSVSFSVSVSGGTAPYTYHWYEETTSVSGQTSAKLTVTKDTAGSYTYYCKITDADGKTTASNMVALTVTSPSTTTTPEAAFPIEAAYAIVAVVIIVIVIVAVAMVLRKRAK